MIDLSEQDKETSRRIFKLRQRKIIERNIVFMGTCIPVLIFISTIYGAWHLFIFSKDFQILFLDVTKTNIILTYAALLLFLVMFIVILPLSIIFWSRFNGIELYNGYIERSNSSLVKNNKDFFFVILYLLPALWPLYFFSFNLKLLPYLFCIAPVLIFSYSLFFTKGVKWQLFKKSFYESFAKRISLLFLLFSPTTFGMLMLLFILDIEKEHLIKLPHLLVLTTTTIVMFLITYIPSKVGVNGNASNKSVAVLVTLVFCLFLIFAFFPTANITGRVANLVGLGYEQRCYFIKEKSTLELPQKYLGPEVDLNVFKLSVVANIDDIYYLSLANQPITKAGIRFKNSNMVRVECPPITK